MQYKLRSLPVIFVRHVTVMVRSSRRLFYKLPQLHTFLSTDYLPLLVFLITSIFNDHGHCHCQIKFPSRKTSKTRYKHCPGEWWWKAWIWWFHLVGRTFSSTPALRRLSHPSFHKDGFRSKIFHTTAILAKNCKRIFSHFWAGWLFSAARSGGTRTVHWAIRKGFVGAAVMRLIRKAHGATATASFTEPSCIMSPNCIMHIFLCSTSILEPW